VLRSGLRQTHDSGEDKPRSAQNASARRGRPRAGGFAAAHRARSRAQEQQKPGRRAREAGAPGPPSEAMLGRIATVIDLLVEAGYDEADAAQMIMRRLLALGVLPPRQGGDARSWSASSFGGPICVTAWPRSVACPQAATA